MGRTWIVPRSGNIGRDHAIATPDVTAGWFAAETDPARALGALDRRHITRWLYNLRSWRGDAIDHRSVSFPARRSGSHRGKSGAWRGLWRRTRRASGRSS